MLLLFLLVLTTGMFFMIDMDDIKLPSMILSGSTSPTAMVASSAPLPSHSEPIPPASEPISTSYLAPTPALSLPPPSEPTPSTPTSDSFNVVEKLPVYEAVRLPAHHRHAPSGRPQSEKYVSEAVADYKKEEGFWKNEYSWRSPGVDSSLQAWMDGLDDEERSLREWIQMMRVGRGVGQKVGLSSSRRGAESAGIEQAPLLPPPTSAHSRGSSQKYADLIREESSDVVLSNGHHVSKENCDVSGWMDSYRDMHMEIVKGEREPKLLTFLCEENCGGLSDRCVCESSACCLEAEWTTLLQTSGNDFRIPDFVDQWESLSCTVDSSCPIGGHL